MERVKLAESLGYESVYTTHIAGRESLTVLTAISPDSTSDRSCRSTWPRSPQRCCAWQARSQTA